MVIYIINVLNVVIVCRWRQCSRGGMNVRDGRNKQRVPIVDPNGVMIQSTVIQVENDLNNNNFFLIKGIQYKRPDEAWSATKIDGWFQTVETHSKQ